MKILRFSFFPFLFTIALGRVNHDVDCSYAKSTAELLTEEELLAIEEHCNEENSSEMDSLYSWASSFVTMMQNIFLSEGESSYLNDSNEPSEDFGTFLSSLNESSYSEYSTNETLPITVTSQKVDSLIPTQEPIPLIDSILTNNDRIDAGSLEEVKPIDIILKEAETQSFSATNDKQSTQREFPSLSQNNLNQITNTNELQSAISSTKLIQNNNNDTPNDDLTTSDSFVGQISASTDFSKFNDIDNSFDDLFLNSFIANLFDFSEYFDELQNAQLQEITASEIEQYINNRQEFQTKLNKTNFLNNLVDKDDTNIENENINNRNNILIYNKSDLSTNKPLSYTKQPIDSISRDRFDIDIDLLHEPFPIYKIGGITPYVDFGKEINEKFIIEIPSNFIDENSYFPNRTDTRRVVVDNDGTINSSISFEYSNSDFVLEGFIQRKQYAPLSETMYNRYKYLKAILTNEISYCICDGSTIECSSSNSFIGDFILIPSDIDIEKQCDETDEDPVKSKYCIQNAIDIRTDDIPITLPFSYDKIDHYKTSTCLINDSIKDIFSTVFSKCVFDEAISICSTNTEIPASLMFLEVQYN